MSNDVLTEPVIRSDYQDAMRMCAEDSGLEPEELRVLRVSTHYRTQIVYVGSSEPRYVIKADTRSNSNYAQGAPEPRSNGSYSRSIRGKRRSPGW